MEKHRISKEKRTWTLFKVVRKKIKSVKKSLVRRKFKRKTTKNTKEPANLGCIKTWNTKFTSFLKFSLLHKLIVTRNLKNEKKI